ncbi:MAG: hypothetical protein NVS9B15_16270 [Acidobacteriaceae bacterium]
MTPTVTAASRNQISIPMPHLQEQTTYFLNLWETTITPLGRPGYDARRFQVTKQPIPVANAYVIELLTFSPIVLKAALM